MTYLFQGALNKVKSRLSQRHNANRTKSIVEVVLGCLAIIYALMSFLLFESSYTNFVMLFLGLVLFFGGAAELLYDEERSPQRRYVLLLRAAYFVCLVPLTAFLVADILQRLS